jgi:clan AA aspartic protease (TIGR02281 family)
MPQCPSCSSFNGSEAAFCNQCGQPLPGFRAPRGPGRLKKTAALLFAAAIVLASGALIRERLLRPGAPPPEPEPGTGQAVEPVSDSEGQAGPAEDVVEPQPLPLDALRRLVDPALVLIEPTDEKGESLPAVRGVLVEGGGVLCRFGALLGAYGGTCKVGRGNEPAREVVGLIAFDDYRDLALIELRAGEGDARQGLAIASSQRLPPGTVLAVASVGRLLMTGVTESPYTSADGSVHDARLAEDPPLPTGAVVAVDPFGAVFGLCSPEKAAPGSEAAEETAPPRVLVDLPAKLAGYIGRQASSSLADMTRRFYEGTFRDLLSRGSRAAGAGDFAAAIAHLAGALDRAEGERIGAEAIAEARDLLHRSIEGDLERRRREKDLRGTEAVLGVAVARFPDERPFWLDLATARMELDNLAGAVEALLEARRIEPGAEIDSLLQRAYAAGSSREVSLGNLQVAAEWLEKGIAVLPSSARLHLDLGKLYQRWGFYEDAVREFNVARSIDPGLGGEVDEALEEIERAVGSREVLVLKVPEGATTIGADVVLNGRATYRFIIDTGATFTSISREMADALGYRIVPGGEEVTVGTANGFVSAPVVLLDSVNLHGYAVRNVKALVLPQKSQSQVGLLGLNFLDHFRYSVDPGRREFRLERR